MYNHFINWSWVEKVFREGAFGTFHEDNFDTQEMAFACCWSPLLLKSSRAKRTPPTWLQLPKPPRPKPAGQVQAAAQTFPEQFEIFNIIFYTNKVHGPTYVPMSFIAGHPRAFQIQEGCNSVG